MHLNGGTLTRAPKAKHPALRWTDIWRKMFLRNGRNQFAADSYARSESNDRRRRRISRGSGSWSSGLVYVLLTIGVLSIGAIIPQLVPESIAYSTAEGLGFTDIQVTNREWLFIQLTGCSESDSVKFTVTGTNASGNQQTFYVCAGLFKGGTPRFR